MTDKITCKMVLKVDLECPKCNKKIKKVLAKFPQIRDQSYDDKQNTVTITVVCCSPEKLRDKLCCKGGNTIKSIEIKLPPKPTKPEPAKPPVPGSLLGACCGSCSVGQGYGMPVPCYDNYGYGYRGWYCRCDYFSEEYTSGCTIM